LGGQTPCYSSLGSFLSPPPIPVSSYANASDTSTLSGINTIVTSYNTTTPSTSRINGNYTASTSYTTSSSLSTSTPSGTDTVTTTFTTVSIFTTTKKPTSAGQNYLVVRYRLKYRLRSKCHKFMIPCYHIRFTHKHKNKGKDNSRSEAQRVIIVEKDFILCKQRQDSSIGLALHLR
jgi:hypothetical protein